MPSAGSVGRRVSGAASQLVLFLVVSVVAGLLLAGLALPVVGGLGLAARAGADTFEPQNLPTPPLPQVSRMLAADGSVIAVFYDQDRIDIPLSKVAPVMREAIVAIEDARFYEHSGLDLRGTLRAAAANRNNDGRTQGGSSITQQYVKNVLLQDAVARNDKEGMRAAVVAEGTEGYVRKLRELQYAIAVEDRLTKDQILERYLNISYFGRLAYGIEAASRRFFSKPASKLTLPEAALLAGIVRNPSLYDPLRKGESKNETAYLKETVINRRNTVLARMAELGYITRQEHAKARASKIVTKPSRVGNGCANARIGGYFCDYAVKVFLDDERYGKTRKDRENLLYRGGVTIRTTLDPKVQRAADKALDKFMDDTDNPIGTVVMLEPTTGDIQGMALNRPYGVDKKKNQFAVNLAVDARYGGNGAQPGSTFKPFLAAAALEQGYGFEYSIMAPYQINRQLRIPTCDGVIEPPAPDGGPYSPVNETPLENGVYDLNRAMELSVNTYFVQLQEKAGLCRPSRIIEQMGIKRANDLKPLDQVGSWTLGAQDISPLDMAKGYATFAARGIACAERSITSVQLRDGKTIDGPQPSCRRVLEPEIADAMSYLLQNVVRNGTGRAADIGRPQAGKTGTSQGFTAWFAGYTPDLAAAVGVWDPRGRDKKSYDLRNVTIGGEVWERVQGAQVPAPIWGAAMKAALKGVEPTPFPAVNRDFFDGTKGPGEVFAPQPEPDVVRPPDRADRDGSPRTPSPPPPPRPPQPDPDTPCGQRTCPKPDDPGPDKPGVDGPGPDKPDRDKPDRDKPDRDKPDKPDRDKPGKPTVPPTGELSLLRARSGH